MTALPYPLVCTLLGLILGWVPMFFHGPIAEKFNRLYINGAIAVWGYYTARCLIGFLVGITTWPRPWWLRGPMCGLLMLLPLTIIALATPGCGWPCLRWNLTTGSMIGFTVGGLAWAVTRRHHC